MYQESFFVYAAEQIIENGYVVFDDLLDGQNLNDLKQRFVELQREEEFEKSGIGKQQAYTIDNNVRGDFIRWIDEKDIESPTAPLFQIVNELIKQFNRVCYLGIKDFETHYAYYPKGKGYEMHRDRFKKNPHRLISFVFYLNENWNFGDGGELVLYNEDKFAIKTIEPIENRLAIFLSETLHEVLACNKERNSITGWLLDIPKEITFITS